MKSVQRVNKNNKIRISFINAIILFSLILCFQLTYSLDPTHEIQLYPNTQNSDSIYIFSFKLQNDIPFSSYILINLDWYSSPLLPFQCIMVNTSIQLQCTNLNNPSSTFPMTIKISQLKQHNPYLTQDYTVAILLKNNLLKDTQYFLQLHLYNTIPNIRKISPSAEMYVVSNDGLIYEENINYGSAIHMPPINIVLQTSPLNPLDQNKPGQLATFKAQFKISQPIQTSLSAFTLVLHHPFSFSLGSSPRTYASQSWTTSPIDLYSKPTIYQYRIISPNIFYVVFNQSFVANRRFILEITQLNNPFFLAQSNISIYSMNYNSLTPLEGNQHNYMIKTITYPLQLSLGFPFDMPATGPRKFYKGAYQYVKLDITILEKTVPTGYAIKIVLTQGTISAGTAYANFQSLIYDPVYEYGSNYIIIKSMGPILVGSQISITFQIYKDPTNTAFYLDAYIDTQSIIKQFTAGSCMYYNRVEGASVTKNGFLNNFYDSVFGTSWRISHDVISSSYLLIQLWPQSSQDTSTGAYLDVYLSPHFIIDNDFDSNNDCRFWNVAGSATCLLEKTPNHLKLRIRSSNDALNPIPKTTYTAIYIYNIFPLRSSSNKYIYPVYLSLFKANSSGTEYYDTHIITVLPKYNGLSKLSLQQYGQVYDEDFTYPSLLRIESTNVSQMSYIIQENQQRVIMLISRYGFVGMGNIANQEEYPCTSNIQVKCIYYKGHIDYYHSLQYLLEWDRIVITFPSNSSQQATNVFHVIVPDSVHTQGDNYYYHLVGVYNTYSKDYKFLYMKDAYRRYSWSIGPQAVNSGLYVDFGGKAGSYKSNVTVYVNNPSKVTGDYSFLCISTSWKFYQKSISTINTATLTGLADPSLSVNQQATPVSVYMNSGMYLTIIPIKYLSSSASTSFTILLDKVHMPYQYDLPSYYIFFYDASGTGTNGNTMTSSNEFVMTNADIFYQSPLQSLTIQCLNNALGVKNTICTIVFGTNNPLKADGNLVFVFSGISVATNLCSMTHSNGTNIPVTCNSTSDNKNLTIFMSGWQHYPSGNFTTVIYGIGIEQSQISQSFTLYLYDNTKKYIIEKGTRILTTTIAKTKVIQVYQILYDYNSPLSYNRMSVKFYLPRKIYQDEEFGIILGKDLSDVNTQIKRLNIVLRRQDGAVINFLYRLISTQYKIIFSFQDISQLIQSNYKMQIYGIRTPASHKNGNFQIIFQRKYDKVFTLINQFTTQFPSLLDYTVSDMSLTSYFNTQGYQQQIDIQIKNRKIPVNDKMIWVVNFPSYYSPLIFNYEPYCLINGSPIQCQADPNTPYQLLIKKSPRIIPAEAYYQISILGIACPRVKYMFDQFPSRYLFIGVLQSSTSTFYEQTILLYPQQNIFNYIQGIINIKNIQVSSTQLTSFYNSYMIIVLKCNIDILSGQYLYIEFPKQFDNFNNKPLNLILKTTNVIGTMSAPVLDRRLQILIPSNIVADTQLRVEITNVPTPKNQVFSEMSQIKSFVTLSTKIKITAASATSGNSAPKITFTKDSRYLTFNNDTQILITAGTYSQIVSIKSSDNQPFLTNVKVSLSSLGFLFEPSQVFLKLGNTEGNFRIAADKDLHPVTYFYTATKQQQVSTFYKITTNNNILITNTPYQIIIPSNIDLPKGGCSQPINIKLLNPPVTDMNIIFNYDNYQFDENKFYPNPYITKSQLKFTKDNDNNSISFCTTENITGTEIQVKLILTGTNYKSYKFSNQIITFNLIQLSSVASPTVLIKMINQQKTFIDFNLTLNVPSNIYYHLFIGDSNAVTKNAEQIQINLKNHISILQTKNDFMTYIYLKDRDQRFGMLILDSGQHTVRFNQMIPQTSYGFCVYLENRKHIITGPFCKLVQTQNWGQIQVLKLTFSKKISNFELNKVMCFFTKYLGTKTDYLVNSQGNSCNDNQVKNTNFNYPATTFSNDKKSTYLYLVTNPTTPSDPSIYAFKNMIDNTNKQLKSNVLTAAVSGYGIDFMTGRFMKQIGARDITSRSTAENIDVSFSKPVFNPTTHQITIQDVVIKQNIGSVYFALIKYKQFITDPLTNITLVQIRLNTNPNPWQLINCKNWQNLTAEACARVTYSGTAVKVTLESIQPNCMYLLYYIGTNQYPFRPIVGYNVYYEPIVTLIYENSLLLMKVFSGIIFVLMITLA